MGTKGTLFALILVSIVFIINILTKSLIIYCLWNYLICKIFETTELSFYKSFVVSVCLMFISLFFFVDKSKYSS